MLQSLTKQFLEQENKLREGGGVAGKQRQQKYGRMTARERVTQLLDEPAEAFELGLWAAYDMYKEWGELPAAGVITIIGKIQNRSCMVIANDATVKAGAFFPQTVKKVLRAQRIAFECRIPIIYLVDSSGVFLPLQDEIFPDEDDFGRIFRNNAVISAAGIPQIAAIMGNCIAGGGYLPVLCDTVIMTEGSGLYLAGPALVKAAIGQVADSEELGGAKMHAEISGTVDFYEPNDEACLKRIKTIVDTLPKEEPIVHEHISPKKESEEVYQWVSADCSKMYDIHDVLGTILDQDSFQEYKAQFGKTLVTGYGKIGGISIGVVANQRVHGTTGKGELEIGGVLYTESADKAARFIMDCNQAKIPLLFLQDVSGFMVGKQAEQSGIIRSGAKLVNALSNSIVPKITILIGNSFGAGHYALGGKAYDPNFILAWPSAKYAVMGAEQATETLLQLQKRDQDRDEALLNEVRAKYMAQMDIRYAAARGWVDAIIEPHKTRELLIQLLPLILRTPISETKRFHTGIIQV